jgi:flagellin-like hook-associated protein FlgL
MRTTNNQMFLSVQSRIARVEEQRAKYLAQIASGNRVSTPSDDPVGITKVMNFAAEEVRISQYGRNMTAASAWLTATDQVVTDGVDILMRAKTLLISTENGAVSQANRDAIAAEMEGMLDNLLTLGNTNNAGSYIFAGHQTRTLPYRLLEGVHGAVLAGDDGRRDIELAPDRLLPVNTIGGGYSLDGREIDGLFKQDKINEADARDLYALFSRVIAELRAGDTSDYRASTALDTPISRNLASGDLSFTITAGDGSGEISVAIADNPPYAVPEAVVDLSDYIVTDEADAVKLAAATNAWAINRKMDFEINDTGSLAAADRVSAFLRAKVDGTVIRDPGTDVTLAAGQLKINGVDIGPISLRAVGTTAVPPDPDPDIAEANVREIATRINEQSGETGVWATYTGSGTDYQLVLTSLEADGEAIAVTVADAATRNYIGLGAGGGTWSGAKLADPGTDTDLAAGDLVINGVDIIDPDGTGATLTLADWATADVESLANVQALAARINAVSERTGVQASYAHNGDNDYNLVLSSSADIVIALGTTTPPDVAALTGLSDSLQQLQPPPSEPWTTVYHPGGRQEDPPGTWNYDSLNSAEPVNGNFTVYDANNGAITLTSETAFAVTEEVSGALAEALGLGINDGTDTWAAVTVSSGRQEEFQRYLDHFEAIEAAVGARMNLVERTTATYEERSINLKGFIADIKEVDISQAIMNYSSADQAYQAALAASARIFSTSILDYLK